MTIQRTYNYMYGDFILEKLKFGEELNLAIWQSLVNLQVITKLLLITNDCIWMCLTAKFKSRQWAIYHIFQLYTQNIDIYMLDCWTKISIQKIKTISLLTLILSMAPWTTVVNRGVRYLTKLPKLILTPTIVPAIRYV